MYTILFNLLFYILVNPIDIDYHINVIFFLTNLLVTNYIKKQMSQQIQIKIIKNQNHQVPVQEINS